MFRCSSTPTTKARTSNLDVGHRPGVVTGKRTTWFAAKQKYFDLGASGVLVARNYLRLVKTTWPKTTFESYSFSDHPQCERWFSLLGFGRAWPYDIPKNCRVF